MMENPVRPLSIRESVSMCAGNRRATKMHYMDIGIYLPQGSLKTENCSDAGREKMDA
jgi:hypothetical protein